MTYATDTHPLIWLLEGSRRLSRAARRAFEAADVQMVIPTIVLAEIKFLSVRKRISVDVAAAQAYAAASNCLIHPLDEMVVARLPTVLNIHDAAIVGTAIVYRDDLGEQVALITKDAEITASGLVDVVW